MAEVKFKRIQDSADINDIPVVDGQLIYTKDGKQFMDYETDRVNLGGSGTNYTLLWENDDPSTAFSSQNITLESGNYDTIIWLCRNNKNNDLLVSQVGVKGHGTYLFFTSSSEIYTRTITYVDDTTYLIGSGYNGNNQSNNVLIPVYAIGVNTGLFGE